MAVTISQDTINEIKTALGYPIQCELDWGSAESDDDYIRNYKKASNVSDNCLIIRKGQRKLAPTLEE